MITIIQQPVQVQIEQNQTAITTLQEQTQVDVIQETDQIVIEQIPFTQFTIQGVLAMGNIIPFSFTATSNGQTSFGPLASVPSVIVCLFIMGTGQDQIAGDFTVNGSTIILGGTAPFINIGDLVYGAYQI